MVTKLQKRSHSNVREPPEVKEKHFVGGKKKKSEGDKIVSKREPGTVREAY